MGRKVVKRKQSGVKEMVYVTSKTRRGKTRLSLRSVSRSLSPSRGPPPSPSKSRRGSDSPSKRQRRDSPALHIVDNDIMPEIKGGRTTKVSESPGDNLKLFNSGHEIVSERLPEGVDSSTCSLSTSTTGSGWTKREWRMLGMQRCRRVSSMQGLLRKALALSGVHGFFP